ncbi:CoA transferase [Variovorax sp. RA8]|uniref:CoA transferase n=1 Tax=Variovorax sp. (strain JCM 16519 / RA8) TaxID=662548 RepID=UPI003FCC800A
MVPAHVLQGPGQWARVGVRSRQHAGRTSTTQSKRSILRPSSHIRGYAAGPQEDDLASNPVAEAARGVMEGNVIEGRPSRLGPSYHDQFAGAYAVIGVLSSLLQAKAGRQSAPVEVGLYETGLHVASRDLVGVQLKNAVARPSRAGAAW